MKYATPVVLRPVTHLRAGSLVMTTDDKGELILERIEDVQTTVGRDILWVRFEGRLSQPVPANTEWLVA